MPRGSRKAEAELGARSRKLDGDLRKAERSWRRFGQRASRDLKQRFTNIARSIGRSLTIAGGAAFALEGRQVLKFEDTLNRLQIQAGATGPQIATVKREIDELSASTGISRNALLGGVEALVNLKGAAGFSTKQLEVLARAQLATGASMEDLAGLAFALDNSMKLKSPEELEKGLSAIIQAGKDGAVPLNQMSVLLQQISADFAKVNGVGVQGAADLAAAMQIARRGFGSAEQSATGLQSLMTALAKNADRLRKSGVQVFDTDPATGVKRFRDLEGIIVDIQSSKLIKDPSKMIKALGRVEAQKAFDALSNNLDAFRDMAAAARESDAVQTDSAKRRQSDAFKIQKAFNDIRLAIASAFTPERIALFVKSMEKIAGFVGTLVDRLPTLVTAWAALKVSPFLGGMLDIARAGGAAKVLDPGASVGKLQFKSQGLLALAALSGIAISEILEAAGDNAIADATQRADFAVFRDLAGGGDTGAFVATDAARSGIAKNGKYSFAAAQKQALGGGVLGDAATQREGLLGDVAFGLAGGNERGVSGRALQILASSIIASKKQEQIKIVVELDDGLRERKAERQSARTP
jgi:hypothetical protein